MTCTVLFVGGPRDGDVIAMPGDEPQEVCEILSGPSLEMMADLLKQGMASPDQEVGVFMFTYLRRVNPLDEGPLWIYVPRDPDWTAPLDERDIERDRRREMADPEEGLNLWPR